MFGLHKRHILLILCFFNAVISYADRTNISIAIIAMTRDFDWSQGTVGFILSSFFYGYICTQMIGGYLSYRFGGKKTLAISCGLWSLFTFLTPLAAPHLFLLILCRICLGLAEGVGFPSIMAMISAHIPANEHSRAIAFVLSGSYLGAVVANLASSALIEMESMGWESTFYIFGVVGLVWLVPWLMYEAPPAAYQFDMLVSSPPVMSRDELDSFGMKKMKSSNPNTPELSMRVDESSSHGSSIGGNDKNGIDVLDENQSFMVDMGASSSQSHSKLRHMNDNLNRVIPWELIMSSPQVWAIIIVSFCQAWSYWLLITWLPSWYNDQFGVNIKKIGYYAVVPYVFQGIVGNVAGLIGDYLLSLGLSKLFVRKFMQSAGMLFCSFFMMIAVLCSTTIVEGMIFITLSMGLYCLTFAGISVNHLDIAPSYAPIIYGIGNTAAQLPGIIGVWVTGVILENTDSNWTAVFGLASFISVVGVFCWITLAGASVVIK